MRFLTVFIPHFYSYPCGWSSYVEQVTHHLDIALESDGSERGSGGYTYEQMGEIWMAANHTKSNVAMMWWYPDTLYQTFVRTDAEFSRISLPPPTQACEEARVSTKDRCSLSEAKRVGAAVGACDETAKPIYKIITESLYDTIYDPEISDATRSPAYDTIKMFQVTGTQLGEIVTAAINGDSLREGVCQWVVNNMDYAQQLIPKSYPRLMFEDQHSGGLKLASILLSSCATILCVISLITVIRQRKRRVMIFAQVEFLYLILVGLLAVSVGAVLSAIPPLSGSCVPIIWLINLGYTLELVPLIAKVGAINRLLNATASMKRVVVRRKSLYGAVIGINLLVCAFLLAWTLSEPPKKEVEYELTNRTSEAGETLVTAACYCTSDRSIWMIVSLVWRAMLLVCATVLAFQNRHLRQDFNESQTLGLMIYSQFVFVVLRIIMYFFLPEVVNQSTLRLWFSMLFSADTIATIMIYFVPKFMTADDKASASNHRGVTVPGTAWLNMLSRSQVERLQDMASINYHDRRMRSELPDSEYVRDDSRKDIICTLPPNKSSDDDSVRDFESCPNKSCHGSTEFGLRHRRTCVHCGEDPDEAVTSDDSQSMSSPSHGVRAPKDDEP